MDPPSDEHSYRIHAIDAPIRLLSNAYNEHLRSHIRALGRGLNFTHYVKTLRDNESLDKCSYNHAQMSNIDGHSLTRTTIGNIEHDENYDKIIGAILRMRLNGIYLVDMSSDTTWFALIIDVIVSNGEFRGDVCCLMSFPRQTAMGSGINLLHLNTISDLSVYDE